MNVNENFGRALKKMMFYSMKNGMEDDTVAERKLLYFVTSIEFYYTT